MPKFLVTGLCFQGNKGGPAIALSLVNAIKKEIPNAQFIFSVPGDDLEWEHEVKSAKKYGFSVVKNLRLKNIIPPFNIFGYSRKLYKNWIKELKECDALIQMSALGFTGPPAGSGTFRSQLGSSRFHDFLMCRITGKKMYAWTQSYGPFSTIAVRIFAKMDFNFQPIIFCRGHECREQVKILFPNKEVLGFPDVAVTLPYDKLWGKQYILKHFKVKNGISSIVTISPSAVMYSRSTEKNNHVKNIKKICNIFLKKNKIVILIPHTLRAANKTLNSCDKEVAQLILNEINSDNLYLVEEDLSPLELKSIISNADYHIGARYHSVVAALSSGVMTISLSWHPKYKDLMQIYGMEKFVYQEGDTNISDMIDSLMQVTENKLLEINKEVEKMVEDNSTIFCRLLKDENP